MLVTGFDGFGTNPAGTVARKLDGVTINGATVISRIVPGAFFKLVEYVKDVIADIQPGVVIMLGVFGGRSMNPLERLLLELAGMFGVTPELGEQ
ncbi:MAG: hypothetical protein P1V19_00435 [Gimesia sp.]|nr:hypothetical protein [Gimesia sp.]